MNESNDELIFSRPSQSEHASSIIRHLRVSEVFHAGAPVRALHFSLHSSAAEPCLKYMPSTRNLSRLPRGTGPLLYGLLLGTAYGVLMSSLWQRKSKVKEAVRPRIVFFGDSLTQYGFDAERDGWLALLAHWWERRFDVVNRGFSGYNTRWLMPLMDRLFVPGAAAPTQLVTIFLGANDCVLPGNAQYVPIDEYKSNLKVMVAHVRKVYPQTRLLLITPPPIHERKWAQHRILQVRSMDREQAVTKSYAIACAEVGQELSVKVVDAYNALGGGDEDLADDYLHDGVHFTSSGNRKLFLVVKEEIMRSFPGLDPEHGGNAGMQAPHWADVDPSNPRESVLGGL